MKLSFRRKAPNLVGPLGRWAVGPLGRWAVGPLGRWAVGPLGHWAVGMSVAVACVVSVPITAQAQEGGSWQVLLEVVTSGTVSTQSTSQSPKMETYQWITKQHSPPTPQSWAAWYLNSYESGYEFEAYSTFGKKASLTGGKIEYYVHLRWEGDPASVPTKGSVMLESKAEATGQATGAVNVQVSGASGSKTITNAFTINEPNGDKRKVKILRSEGKKLIPFSNSDGTTELRLGPFTSSISGNVTSPAVTIAGNPSSKRYPKAQIVTTNSANVSIDNRSVRLTRPGAVGEELKVENDVNVTYGDTTYSYRYPPPFIRPIGAPDRYLHENSQWIQASFGGKWLKHRIDYGVESYGKSYKWSPEGNSPVHQISAMGSRYTMPEGQLFLNEDGKWEGKSSVGSHTTYSVNYEVTDDDDTSVTAVYNLRVHNPIEVIDKDNWEVYYLTDYAPPGGGMVTVGYPNKIGGDYEMTKSDSSGWSVSSTVGDIELFEIPLGVDLSVGYEETHEEGTTEIAPTPLDEDGNEVRLQEGERVHLRVRHKFQRHYASFDRYNEAGKVKRYSSAQSGIGVEIPHEAIWDVFLDNEFAWTDPYSADDQMPEIDEDKRQLPPKEPSYRYSLKEDTDAQPVS